jgi:hypothetical protein
LSETAAGAARKWLEAKASGRVRNAPNVYFMLVKIDERDA